MSGPEVHLAVTGAALGIAGVLLTALAVLLQRGRRP